MHENLSFLPVNDRKYVFHFRPKPKPKSEKHLALGRIPKPKPKVQIYVNMGGFCYTNYNQLEICKIFNEMTELLHFYEKATKIFHLDLPLL
jgi:hypothetical protein